MNNATFAICVILVLFVSLNMALTLTTAILWRFLDAPSLKWSAKGRARLAFALRVFPTIFPFLFLSLLFAPAFAIYEKYNPGEFIRVKLAVLTFISSVCITWAVIQSLLSLLRTRFQITKWAREENRLNLKYTKFPAYRIKHVYPMLAVVGFFKPKIFVDARVLEILNENELAAVIAHEHAHVELQDNWKRLALKFCKSLLIFPFNTRIETAWETSVEAVADKFASNGKHSRSLDLASALAKLARVMTENPKAKLVASHISSDWQTPVAWRIHRLIKLAGSESIQKEDSAFLNRSILKMITCALAVSFLFFTTQTDLLFYVHHFMEFFVKALV
jgi:Zn-dependent protease with chaperone function